jgi:hypothetical protein
MRILKWFALWLVLAIAIGMMVGRNSVNYYRLSRHGVAVEGIARKRKPHMLIEYSFTANGQTYNGLGKPGVGAPAFYEISIGERVPVYYLTSDPEINCLGDPQRLFSGEIGVAFLACLLFPTMIVCVVAYRVSRYEDRRNW